MKPDNETIDKMIDEFYARIISKKIPVGQKEGLVASVETPIGTVGIKQDEYEKLIDLKNIINPDKKRWIDTIKEDWPIKHYIHSWSPFEGENCIQGKELNYMNLILLRHLINSISTRYKNNKNNRTMNTESSLREKISSLKSESDYIAENYSLEEGKPSPERDRYIRIKKDMQHYDILLKNYVLAKERLLLIEKEINMSLD